VTEPLLIATGLHKRFRAKGFLRRSTETCALDDVSIEIHTGEVVALIGESGSGKTTLGKALLRLMPLDAGSVRFAGRDVFALSRSELRAARHDFQMVFQNQSANLHPKMTVRQMMDESLRLHRPDLDADGRGRRTHELLDRVSLVARADQRPASLSGGEKRRVGLARILATRPKLVVADEPTSGLDAAIKLQTIELLKSLKEESLTYLLISHDLSLVRRIADRVLVMLKGRVIEEVPASMLGTEADHHPYTGRLMRAADLLEDHGQPARERRSLPRGIDLAALERQANEVHRGCVHASDCPLATDLGILRRCTAERPGPVEIGAGHWIACFAAEERARK